MTTRTEYSWDHADNRLSKDVYQIDDPTTSMVSTVSYTNNALNQMVGYEEIDSASSVTSVVNYAYDYRSRRYYRSASDADHMYCVFDSGLSIQEYNVEHASSLLSAATPATEFIRGEGM